MNLYNPKNMLVTGGAGFIGSHFILMMLKQHPSLTIVNVDKLTYAASLENLASITSPNYFFEKADICDAAHMEKLIRHFDIDTIVHFAAESHVDRSIAGPEIFIQTNVMGTFNLLENARKIWLEENNWDETQCRFHHISTDEVYGTLKKSDPPFQETTAYAPNSPYSASKASSDHLVRAYQHTYQMPTTLSNCSNNYGPHQHTEKLIPTIIRQILLNQPIPIYGDGSNIRDWLYVTDHCEAIAKIIFASKTGETYNIGGNAECSNLVMAQTLCHAVAEHLKQPAQKFLKLIEFVTDRAGHDWRYAIDATKIQQELNWHPKHNLESGLKDTIQGYLQQGNLA